MVVAMSTQPETTAGPTSKRIKPHHLALGLGVGIAVFTALSGAWIVPGIAGPLVAGAVTDAFGWRWVFFGVLILLIPVGVILVPRLQAMHVDPDPDAVPATGRKRLALIAAVGLVLLQVAGQRLDASSLVVAPVELEVMNDE